MKVFTIGESIQGGAERFFKLLLENHVQIVIDIRVINDYPDAGFSKARDLPFFLQHVDSANIDYVSRKDFAPSLKLLNDTHAGKVDWQGYIEIYQQLIQERGTWKDFLDDFGCYKNVCLLCFEATPEQCHRRLLAEKLQDYFTGQIEVKHLV
ncbi:MAG: DUF488 domain-containing protein [Erysipelotrichaceae bacterium]|jgi:uncharacterized protein YeaO (DUF488 family)|nr:DUF488 domain-containing protein [Erysipelotrichaceae bacterium]